MDVIPTIPIVMTFGPSDPTGGGGIQADIETLFGLGCHCCPIITGITAQDTSTLKDYTLTTTSLVIEQARVILEETPINTFKINLTGKVETFVALYTLLKEQTNKPIIINIPRKAFGSSRDPDEELINAVNTLLLPLANILILDTKEAKILAPEADNNDACAQKFMGVGCEYVLIKNCHGIPTTVENMLYGNHRFLEKFVWERIPGNYHGCGCTLGAAVAALVAHGLVPIEAIIEAQKYTWECIKRGVRLGIGSRLPDRLYWARNSEKTS